MQKYFRKVEDGIYEYETDGLIFTPALLGVGHERQGDGPKPPLKTAWNTHSNGSRQKIIQLIS